MLAFVSIAPFAQKEKQNQYFSGKRWLANKGKSMHTAEGFYSLIGFIIGMTSIKLKARPKGAAGSKKIK